MTIRIVTDSACDLPQYLIDQHKISIVPLSVRFGEHEFIDRQDLTTEQFWTRCDSSPVLPETAAPSPGQFEAEFRKLAAEGATGIVMVALSGVLSATMQSAELAAKAVAGHISVRVVDSRSGSMGQGGFHPRFLVLLRAGPVDEIGNQGHLLQPANYDGLQAKPHQ